MKREIQIELEDGRIYCIDAHKVAHDRATDVAEAGESYQEQYEHMMTEVDGSDLIDWLLNNMDWYELEPRLIRDISPPLLRHAKKINIFARTQLGPEEPWTNATIEKEVPYV